MFIERLNMNNAAFRNGECKVLKFTKTTEKCYVQTPYGICKPHANNLLAKGCNYVIRIKGAVDKTSYFKNKMDALQPKWRRSIKILKYEGSTCLIENKYGKCRVFSGHVLNGYYAKIRTALDKTSYFINQAREKHGDRYDYSKVEYKGCKSDIVIICPKHGEFLQTPTGHLYGGCQECGNEKVNTLNTKSQDECISKFRKAHGNRYDYSRVKYTKGYNKVTIGCGIHGWFEQRPNDHWTGRGCAECSLLNKGYRFSQWLRASPKNKAKLYVIRCWNDNEEFYKVGITVQEVRERFSIHGETVDMPYKYEVMSLLESDDRRGVWDLENQLKREFKEYKYIPKILFGGYTECFKFN